MIFESRGDLVFQFAQPKGQSTNFITVASVASLSGSAATGFLDHQADH